jgi:uncharacterized protein involved in type VI secretion and phage assembly
MTDGYDAGPPDFAARMFGVVIGVVTNNHDPLGLGRVKVGLPWMSEAVETDWARVATPMAGPDRGIYFIPEVNDEVLVAFEHGNPEVPYVLGGLWNGEENPPAANNDGRNNVRVIKSRSGSTIRFDDDQNDPQIEIADSSGKNKIVIRTADNSVTITATGDITVSAGGTLKLSGNNVEIAAKTVLRVEGSQSTEVKSNGALTVKGSVVNIN